MTSIKAITLVALGSLIASVATANIATATPEPANQDQIILASNMPGLTTRSAWMEMDFKPPTFEYDDFQSHQSSLALASTWQSIGTNAVVEGDYENALAAFEKAIDLDVDSDATLLQQRGWLYYRMGHKSHALNDLWQAASFQLNQGDYAAYQDSMEMHRFVDFQL